MSQENDEIDLGALIGTLWRGRWIVLGFAVAFAAIAYFYGTRIAVPQYRAVATVAIENREQQLTSLDSLVSGLSAEQPSLNTEVYVIRSRTLLERLVAAEGLLEEPEFNPLLAETRPYTIARMRESLFGPAEKPAYSQERLLNIAIDRVLSRLSVSNPRQSFVFELAVTSESAEMAASLANTVAALYINDQLLVKDALSQVGIDFLTDRTASLQRELGVAELDVKDFAATTDLVDIDTLAAKNRQVRDLRERIDALTVQFDSLDDQINTFSSLELAEIDVDFVQATSNRAFSTAFARWSTGLITDAEFEDALNQLLVRMIEDRDRFAIQMDSLQESVAALLEQISKESENLLALQQLEREAEATREIYSYFLTRLKEAEVQQGTQQPDARLLSGAVVPVNPISPRVSLILALGVVLGAMVGAGLVLLQEMRQQVVRTADDLGDLSGHVVIGQVPIAPIKRRDQLVDYLTTNRSSPYSEAIRNLRTSIVMNSASSAPQTFLVTSSILGEGKTTIAISLATSMAGLGMKVLLVEADIRRRTFTNYFNIPDYASLVSAVEDLTHLKDNMYFSPELGIDVLPGGASNLNAADFLSSVNFAAFLEQVKADYDYVILDAPPVLAVPDARIIGALCDVVIYTCAWDSTQRGQVKAGLATFDSIGQKVDGMILSKIDLRKAYKYGSYGKYGGYYSAVSAYYDAK